MKTHFPLALMALVPGTILAADPVRVELHLDPTQVIRTFEPKRLSGTNIALWIGAEHYQSPQIEQLLRDSGIALYRIPGGSWSDITFWNGHGVRDPQTGRVDPTRVKDGYPAIDYSAYAPSITVENNPPHAIRNWHGNVDVKTLHEYIERLGAQTMVCVNAGTGRPLDAAEWVRWANQTQGYGVRYWEVGNELDGTWEAGHFLADGSRLTGEMYAKRFADFAKAMKAIDPSIRVGGPASGIEDGGFTEVMMRDAGQHVDYISIHTYPGNPLLSTEEQFKRVGVVREHVERARRYIEQYQPERKDEIEIAYTEWNLPATRVACELTNALWSALFLREMAVAGVDFATQWDAMTQGPDEEGGHALIMTYTNPPTPKSQYWAMRMWNEFVGREALASGRIEGTSIEYFTTREGGQLRTMLVNLSEDTPAEVRFTGVPDADWMLVARYSSTEYLWNPYTRRPQWNEGVQVEVVDMPSTIELPAFSLTFVTVGEAGAERPELPAPPERGEMRLALIAPEEAFANEQVEVIVTATEEGTRRPAPRGTFGDATLLAGEKEVGTVSLAQPAGRLFFRPEKPGELELTVRAGEKSATKRLTVKAAEPRPVILWDAEEPALTKDAGYESDWKLSRDETVRANQPVVRVDVEGKSTDGNPVLLRLSKIPDSVNREGIRGVFFDLRSLDITSSDPQARVDVVLQSEANWWMHLGSVPLRELGEWKTYRFALEREEFINAAPQMRNIWLVLRAEDAPRGTVYLDRVGFDIR